MQKKRNELDRCRSNSIINRSKKAQVTIFIILGIILLLAGALIFLFQKEVFTFKPEEIILTEKGKIENYISGCITEIGDEALFLAGLQAGYVEVPEDIFGDGNQHLKLSPENVVPYWARESEVSIPSLDYIEEEINKKIEEGLRDCLLGREAFEGTYDIIEKSNIEASTEAVAAKTIFNVKWDLEIKDKAGEVITELIDHTAESPIKLKRVYETAKKIMERELTDLKLEYLTQDLIALEHSKVPVSGIELSCSKKKWKVSEAKDTLKDMLRVNIRELKVEGTNFVEFPDELPYYQNHYVWDIGEISKDVSVVFNFDSNYPFLFYVTPQKSGILESGMQGGSDMLSFLCLQTWKFTYDISYPVLVRVRDETTGYNFQTAFTVHLVKNTPKREAAETRSPSHFVETITGEDYCRDMNMLMTVNTYELVENNQGVYWREPLEDVDVSLTCLKYRCEIGQSEYGFEGRGHVAGLRTVFPYCVGGILRGEKEDYKENWERVVTKNGEEFDLDLIPLFKFPVEGLKVVKHEFEETMDGILVGGAEKLDADETVMIKLVNKKEGKDFHEVEWAISPGLDKKIVGESEIEFLGKADFEYEVEIYVFDEDEMKGGYKGNWTADWDELKNGEEIVFHTVCRESFDDETEMFGLILSLEDYSIEVPLPEIR